jgi:prepilin-type N-terminal cleavage/methylation domain-containing protein
MRTARTLRRRPIRGGFSLLEVILSLAILAGAMASIGVLVDIGIKHSHAARAQTEAQLLCEAKMAEIAAGILSPDPVSMVPVDAAIEVEGEEAGLGEMSEWVYSIEVSPVDGPAGLVAVRVTVEQDPGQVVRPAGFSLTRWIPDPGIAMAEEETTTDPAASSSTSSSTTSSSSSGTGNAANQGGS